MADLDLITVEVAFALPQKQKIVELLVEPGTTAYQTVERSGIDKMFAEIDLSNAKMGIFSQTLGIKGLKSAREYIMQPSDRVEIYRPLTADPKEIRRKRAEKAKQEAGE